jgi:NAD(P)-dependent dehydrogenase (short-subunit alcohol dehydrogenase family)
VISDGRYDRRRVAPTRTILITGCSSPQGIGFATARALAERGHRVHATVRDHSIDGELRRGFEERLAVHTLDLLEPATIDSTLDAVLAADQRLDVLINNAGYGLIGGVEQVDVDQARAQFETNLFGTMTLVQRVLPIMRNQRQGHIVNISTVFAAGLTPPAIGYYVASKAALETVCQSLAFELAPWDIQVTNYQPGPVMTELSRQWGDRLSADQDPAPDLIDHLYRWVAGPDAPAMQSPAEVAAALSEFLDAEPSGLADQSGAAARAYVAAALRDPTRAAELASLLAEFERATSG